MEIKKTPSEAEKELLESPTWEHRKVECKLEPFDPYNSEKRPVKQRNLCMNKISLFGTNRGAPSVANSKRTLKSVLDSNRNG